jgi:hypothetical protein
MAVDIIKLEPQTLDAFEKYVADVELEVQAGGNVWSADDAKRLRDLRNGQVLVEQMSYQKRKVPFPVPHGLIHDLTGTIFVPGTTVRQVLARVQDYAGYKNVYEPEVMDSQVVSRKGDEFRIYLRLLKKKIITVVLDTYHDVRYSSPDPDKARCRSITTQVLEVEHAGTPTETRLAPDSGHGFLWRLYSHWRFEAGDGGVFMQCRAVSLTRDIPMVLALIVKPIVQKLPRESLAKTLTDTRNALTSNP